MFLVLFFLGISWLIFEGILALSVRHNPKYNKEESKDRVIYAYIIVLWMLFITCNILIGSTLLNNDEILNIFFILCVTFIIISVSTNYFLTRKLYKDVEIIIKYWVIGVILIVFGSTIFYLGSPGTQSVTQDGWYLIDVVVGLFGILSGTYLLKIGIVKNSDTTIGRENKTNEIKRK